MKFANITKTGIYVIEKRILRESTCHDPIWQGQINRRLNLIGNKYTTLFGSFS